MEYLDEELQAEIVDEDVAERHEEIPYDLRPATQGGARKTDMPCHPEAREEGDGELEHEGCNVGRESDETEVEHLSTENEMIEHIIEHPFQNQVEPTASRIAEQFEAHHLAERWIEEVNDRGQGAFRPGFYVLKG